eukprot:Gregarina_sp_Poly_1__638@NODE_1150_length_4930_cov_138_418877_g792_i0_p2_GENE_NODE_1150_length_4930_cov_138_418877_g792_i0NODE_1150_length_4930_cov_138_418877_g792_i0_p2_ORF_typecomplete_len170_score20_29DUF5134/PF17197_4/0_059DUF3153/PF11353_8/0_16SPW/PF03779_14/0_2DUF4381/PF14316_6/1_1_NODE_1150_length_4930_cov_138_418877_g792_i04961005
MPVWSRWVLGAAAVLLAVACAYWLRRRCLKSGSLFPFRRRSSGKSTSSTVTPLATSEPPHPFREKITPSKAAAHRDVESVATWKKRETYLTSEDEIAALHRVTTSPRLPSRGRAGSLPSEFVAQIYNLTPSPRLSTESPRPLLALHENQKLTPGKRSLDPRHPTFDQAP